MIGNENSLADLDLRDWVIGEMSGMRGWQKRA